MATDGRHLDLDLTVKPFGKNGLLLATSEQMPNLRVTGTDDADLWDCLQPVITSLVEAAGDRVQSMTVDRSHSPHDIKVHVQVAPAQ